MSKRREKPDPDPKKQAKDEQEAYDKARKLLDERRKQNPQGGKDS